MQFKKNSVLSPSSTFVTGWMGKAIALASIRFSRGLAVALIAGAIFLSGKAQAQTWNQTGASTTESWNLGSDWTGGSYPNASGAAAYLDSDLTGAETVNLNTAITVGTLSIGANGGSTYKFLLAASGGSLTMNSGDTSSGAGASITEVSTAYGDTISAGINMADLASTTALTITNNSANSLTLSGGITGTGNLLLDPTAGGSINASAGSGINNSGTVTFTSSGLNTYSTIAIGSNVTQVLDNSNNSSTLQISPLAVNSNGTTLVYSATGGSAALNVTGAVTGSGNLIFDNTTTTGSKFTDSNTINLTGGVINNSSGSGAIVVSGVIGGTVAATTVTQNKGALTLDAANLYTGTTTVNGGTLLLDFSQTGAPTNNIIYSGNSIVLGGGTFSIKGKGGTTTNSQTLVMSQTASTGLSSLVVSDNSSSGSTTLALGSGGLGTRGTGDTLNIDLSQGLGGNAAGDAITTSASAATLGWATVKDATDTGFATYNGANVVRLTGQTTLAAGSNSSSTDFITTPAGTTTTGSPYLTLAASTNPSWDTLTIKSAGTGANFLDLGGNTVTLTQNALLMTSSSTKAFTIQNGQVGAANSEVIVQQMGTGTLTIGGGTNGATISSGTGSLTKSGSGTLLLTSANTYSGGTNVNQGTLQAGVSSTTSGSGSGETITNGATGTGLLTVVTGGTVDLSTFNLAVGGLSGSGSTIGSSATTGSGETLSLVGNGTTQAYSGTIANTVGSGTQTLAVTMAGTGTQVFSGANTYSGGTTVSSGFLSVSNTTGSATGTAAVAVNSGGTLGGGNTSANSGTLATYGTGADTGTLMNYTPGHTGIISGALNINSGGTLAPGNNSVGTITAGSLTLASGSILNFAFNGTANSFTSVTGSGGLTLNGGGFDLYQEGTSTAFDAVGTYNLLGYTGTLGGSVSNLSVLNQQSGFNYNFVNDTPDDLIQLDITAAPEPSTPSLLLVSLVLVGCWKRRQLGRVLGLTS